MSCIVVIPVYKPEPDPIEVLSLKQCISVLKKHDICLIKPQHLNISAYQEIFAKYGKSFKVESFDDVFFTSVQGYSKLCLKKELYQRFNAYDYMFLYQLDGWVFADELEYWCNQNYDYIGAPWFKGYSKARRTAEFIEPSGNGGVSLRNIKTFIKILSQSRKTIKIKEKETSLFTLSTQKNEDFIIVSYFSLLFPEFNIAKPEVSMRFSFEVNPDRLYEMTRKLPFACHAFMKYNPDFWKKYIDLKDIKWPKTNIFSKEKLTYKLFGWLPLWSIENK